MQSLTSLLQNFIGSGFIPNVYFAGFWFDSKCLALGLLYCMAPPTVRIGVQWQCTHAEQYIIVNGCFMLLSTYMVTASQVKEISSNKISCFW